MNRLSGFLLDNLQIRCPHVTTHVAKLTGALGAEPGEKTHQRILAPLLSEPQQSFATLINLVHQCQVFMAFSPLYLIHSNGFYA